MSVISIKLEVDDTGTAKITQFKSEVAGMKPPSPAVAAGFAALQQRILATTGAAQDMAQRINAQNAVTADGYKRITQAATTFSDGYTRMVDGVRQNTETWSAQTTATEHARRALVNHTAATVQAGQATGIMGAQTRTAIPHSLSFKDRILEVTGAAQKMARVMVSVQVIMATVVAVMGVRQIIEAADAWATLSARLRLVSATTAEAATASKLLFALAQDIRTPLADAAELYVRIGVAMKGMGLSQNEMIALTRTVAEAIMLGGASAQEAASSVRQFTQALASGKVDMTELRPLLENAPPLVQALAAGLRQISPEFVKLTESGKSSIGALQEMSKKGTLSSEMFYRALLTQTGAVHDQFKELPMTVGSAFTKVSNEFLRLAGTLSTSGIVTELGNIRKLLEDPLTGEPIKESLQGVLTVVEVAIGTIPRLAGEFLKLTDVLTIIKAGFVITGQWILKFMDLLYAASGGPANALRALLKGDLSGAKAAMVDSLNGMKKAIADYSETFAREGEKSEKALNRLFGRETVERVVVSAKDIKWAFKQLEQEFMKVGKARPDSALAAGVGDADAVKKANEAISKQIETLKVQRIELEHGSLAALEYSLAHGELAKASPALKAELVALTQSVSQFRIEQELALQTQADAMEELRELAKREKELAEATRDANVTIRAQNLLFVDAGRYADDLRTDVDEMIAGTKELVNSEKERIDLLARLNQLSPAEANQQGVQALERGIAALKQYKIEALSAYGAEAQVVKDVDREILRLSADQADLLSKTKGWGSAFKDVFEGALGILSLFGVKIGKFILMLQNLPQAFGGLSRMFDGINSLARLAGVAVGATLPGTAAAAVESLGKAAGVSSENLSGLSGVVGLVERALMLFGNGLMGIFSFFGSIVQGIASGGGIINTISSALSGLVSSGGALFSVFSGLSNVGSALFSVFTEGTSLAGIFQSAFNALGIFSTTTAAAANVATQGAMASGAGLVGSAAPGAFANFLGQWVPIAGALYMAAMAIQNFFSGSAAVKIGTGIGLVLAGPFGAYLGGIIGGFFGPAPKATFNASILPFNRKAMGSTVIGAGGLPGTQVGAGLVEISGNVMKGSKERALQEALAIMINDLLIHVVDAAVMMIKVLPPAIGAQLDAALTQLETTGLDIVDKKWKGDKAGKKFNKRVKGLMEETLQDLVTALDFGDVDLKALGFDPKDHKGKKGGEVARGFEAMMMALGGLSAIVKEVGLAVDLSSVSLSQFTKGAIDLFKGFQTEGEAFTDTIKRVMQTFGEIIAVKDQIHTALQGISGDMTEVVAIIKRRMADAEASMVSMVDALTVAIESGGTPEEVLAAAKAATQAVLDTLKMQIDAVTAMHDAVVKLNGAIASSIDFFVSLTQKINALRGRTATHEEIGTGIGQTTQLFNATRDIATRIALLGSALTLLSENMGEFDAHVPLMIAGFNSIMRGIRQLANPQEALANLKLLATAIETSLQAEIAAVQRMTQEKIAALNAERSAIQANFAAQRSALEAQKSLVSATFDARRRALEAEKSAISMIYDAQKKTLQTQLDLAQKWASVLQSVKSQLVDLYNLLAPTHPQTSLNDIQAQFFAAFAAFQQKPTTEGAEKVQELAKQLLQLAQQTPGYDLSSLVFQTLAKQVQSALEAVQKFAASQPTQEDIQAQIAALNEKQAASLASIDQRIAALNVEETKQLAAIDAQIAALNASEAAALANIDRQIAAASAAGQARIQELQDLAALGLEKIREQVLVENQKLMALQADAAKALQAVLGDKTYEEFIATKQAEAADLLRGIDRTLQEYLGAIVNGLGFKVPAMAEGGVVMPRAGGTIVRLAEAGYPEMVTPLRGGSTSGGGQTININLEVHADRGTDGQKVGREAIQTIKEAILYGELRQPIQQVSERR